MASKSVLLMPFTSFWHMLYCLQRTCRMPVTPTIICKLDSPCFDPEPAKSTLEQAFTASVYHREAGRLVKLGTPVPKITYDVVR
jgi:hypothetical protein